MSASRFRGVARVFSVGGFAVAACVSGRFSPCVTRGGSSAGIEAPTWPGAQFGRIGNPSLVRPPTEKVTRTGSRQDSNLSHADEWPQLWLHSEASKEAACKTCDISLQVLIRFAV